MFQKALNELEILKSNIGNKKAEESFRNSIKQLNFYLDPLIDISSSKSILGESSRELTYQNGNILYGREIKKFPSKQEVTRLKAQYQELIDKFI